MRPIAARVALLGVWLWAGIAVGTAIEIFRADPLARDAHAFYLSARAWVQHGDLYDAARVPNVNLNPPHVSVALLTPLAWLPTMPALIVWQLAQLAAFVAACRVMARELGLRQAQLIWIVPLVMASAPIDHQLREGQAGGVLMLLAVLAWRAARREQTMSVAWIAAAASFKPWLVCWLPALPWRRAAAVVALGMMGIAAGVALTGVEPWREWQAIVGERRVFPNPANLSLVAWFARIERAPLVSTPGNWPYGQPLWSVLALAVTVVSFLRARSMGADQRFLVLGLAGILVSPLGWAYYLVVVLAPFVAWGQARAWPWPVLLAVGLLLVPRDTMFWLSAAGWGWIGGSLGALGALLVWTAAVASPVTPSGSLRVPSSQPERSVTRAA